MFRKLDNINALKSLIKLAAVTLTSPATVAVAGSLYPYNPITSIAVSIAALVLIEGCLLLGWEMLDKQGRNATHAQRWLYAGLAWTAYISLFGIALYHNEGIAGLAFRLTLGVVLMYASAEAGLLASNKTRNQADKDIMKDRRVKRYARKNARQSAMADLDLTAKLRQLEREAHEKLYTLQIARDTERQIHALDNSPDFESRKPVEMAKSYTHLTAPLRQANHSRSLSKQEAIDKTLHILTSSPTAGPTEIAAQIGKSRQTVYDYFNELEAVGKIRRNGSVIRVIK